MRNMKQPMNSSSPHFWWIVGTMGVIIIALTAFILTKRIIGVKVIVDYISFASLLLSIILSIFAILFTHSSNIQTQNQFDKINSAADSTIRASEKIGDASKEIQESMANLVSDIRQIKLAQGDLITKLSSDNKVPDNIKNIDNTPA